MKKAVFSLFILFGFSLHLSASDMVFLIEDDHGKNIGISERGSNTFDYFTKDDNWNLYPDISPDGRYIVHVRGKGQSSLQLVVKDRKLKTVEIFGNQKGYILHPRFSNNGKKVFFTIERNGKHNLATFDLEDIRNTIEPKIIDGEYVYDIPYNIIDTGDSCHFPSPFSAGDRLIYQRNINNQREIVFYNLLTKEKKIIAKGMSPSLSKDEIYITYTHRVSDENWEVFIYDRLKKQARRATFNESWDLAPIIDGEGNLIFSSNRSGKFGLYKKNKKDLFNDSANVMTLLAPKDISLYAPKLSGDTTIIQKELAPMIGKARSSFAAVAHQNKVYVVGGHQGKEHTYPPESFSDRFNVYDIATNTWKELSPRPHKAHGLTMTAHKNYIYAFGGFAYDSKNKPAWKSISVVDRYDIKSGKWESIANMPRNRSSNVIGKIGNKVYLIGGWDATPKFENDYDGTFHDAIDVFDLETEKFSTLKIKLPLKRRAFSAFVRDSKIYLAGGISEGASHFDLLDKFSEFDPAQLKFTDLKPLPFATFAPGIGYKAGRVFLFGGMLNLGEWLYEYTPHIFTFDFAEQKWLHSERYLVEEKGFSQVVDMPDGIGVLGGHSYQNNSDAPVNTFEIFK